MAVERNGPRLVPRAELAGLRSGALLARLEEWIHQHYVPAGAYQADSADEENEENDLLPETTLEVLEAFTDILDTGQLAGAAAQIDKQSTVWVRRRGRRVVPSMMNTLLLDGEPETEMDRTGGREPEDIVSAAYEKLLDALSELEAVRAQVEPVSSSIGGNFPPEEIGLPPYNEDDDKAVRVAISVLQAQPVLATVPSPAAENAVEVLQTTGEKLLKYAGSLADAWAKEFAKSLGKSAGVGVTALSLWGLLGEKLVAAAQAAGHWLEAIKLFM